MPSVVTDYGQDFIANILLGKATTVPTTYYIALLFQSPDTSVTGSGLVEPTTGGYARQAVTNNATNWGPSAAGIITNNTVISWGIATADYAATVTDYAFCDAATAGNVFFTGSLRVPRQVQDGDLVTFGVSLLAFSINGISQIIVGT